jgi:formate dehydrogenase major subunit
MGRGGATTFQMDLANADCILIMGSNFAEAHPVGFRFVMRARERGATILHVDPRFTRTSACSSLYVPIRAGSDIAFLGGLIHYVLNSERWNTDPFFREYVLHYTNAATLVQEEFRDAAELGGLFSGWDAGAREYHGASWEYEGQRRVAHGGEGGEEVEIGQVTTAQARGTRTGRAVGPPPPTDPTLEHPRCVLQVLKRHFSPYTIERVEEICGVPRERFIAVAESLLRNSGRDRTTAIAYAVGWTQHTTGPQIIACAAILQLLLGNIGRPGGGIQALRGHATIQGSTDIPTLYDLLPGYLPMPTHTRIHATLVDYIWNSSSEGGLWAKTDAFIVSLLKAWFGDEATAENEWGYPLLPRITGDHSHIPMFVAMHEGRVEGLLLMGQNPAVGGQNAGFQRRALSKLKWLVVRDLFPIESATFWYDSPEVRSGELRPEEIGTEVFLLPGATVAEKDGSFTNTQRLIQWHDKAVDPPGDCRSEAWFMVHLGRRLKRLYRDSAEPKDRPILALTWDYPLEGPLEEPDVEVVQREINGYRVGPQGEGDGGGARPREGSRGGRDMLRWTVGGGEELPGIVRDPRALWAAREQVRSFNELEADGSTACGCWIYSGVNPGTNRARSRVKGDGYVAPEWAFSWPNNVRMLYNRCSADPAGRPWSERKKYVWWDEAAGRWVGKDTPDFPAEKRPDDPGDPEAVGVAALSGDSPFLLKPEGKAWLYFKFGMKDAPLPTHYEPWESPVHNALYREHERNPMAKYWDVEGNPYHGIANPEFPYVLTTYRLTEHHTAGGMTRWNSWLAELQPAAFVEISPELAAERGIEPGGWVTVRTARGEAVARALVTRRMRPLRVGGRTVHQVGFPWHFGYAGLVKGSSANDLVSLVADPNVSIHEGKVLTCDIRAGRSQGA